MRYLETGDATVSGRLVLGDLRLTLFPFRMWALVSLFFFSLSNAIFFGAICEVRGKATPRFANHLTPAFSNPSLSAGI